MKQTIKNFYLENKMLASILIGAIGFPIAMFAVAGVIALALVILSFFFGELIAAAILLMMLVGAVGGYVWGYEKK